MELRIYQEDVHLQQPVSLYISDMCMTFWYVEEHRTLTVKLSCCEGMG